MTDNKYKLCSCTTGWITLNLRVTFCRSEWNCYDLVIWLPCTLVEPFLCFPVFIERYHIDHCLFQVFVLPYIIIFQPFSTVCNPRPKSTRNRQKFKWHSSLNLSSCACIVSFVCELQNTIVQFNVLHLIRNGYLWNWYAESEIIVWHVVVSISPELRFT